MPDSTIENALSKGQRNYARLTGQTVPLFKKMSQGTIKKEELERLKDLYKEQSEAASATLEAGVKAVKESAKTATSEAVKRLVKGGKLSSTTDIKKMLDASLAIAFQQAAPLIQKAVNEALEKPVERIEDLIADVRRLQVKADHIFYVLGIDANNPKGGKVSAQGLMASAKDKHEEFVSLAAAKKDLDKQADTIAKKVASLVGSFLQTQNKENVKRSEKIQKEAIDAVKKRGTVALDLDGNGMPATAAAALELYRQKMGLSAKSAKPQAKKVPNALKKMTTGFGLFEQKAQKITNANAPKKVAAVPENVAQVLTAQGFNSVFAPGVMVDPQGEKETKLDKVMDFLSRLSGTGYNNLQKRAERAFVEKLKASGTSKEDQKAILQRLQYIRKTKSSSADSAQAYERFSKMVMRDLANTWKQSAQDKIKRYKDTVSKHWDGIAKATKIAGYMFLGSMLVNALNKIFPTWMESLKGLLSSALEGFITKAIPWLIQNIGPIIADTFSFIISHLPDIVKGVLKVMGMIVGQVAKTVLSLLGFDKQAEPKQNINQAYYQSEEFKNFAKANGLTEAQARTRLETANQTDLSNLDDDYTRDNFQASIDNYQSWNVKKGGTINQRQTVNQSATTASVTTNTGSPIKLAPSTTVNSNQSATATMSSKQQVFPTENAHVNTIDTVPTKAPTASAALNAKGATTTGAKVTVETIPNMMGGDLMVQNAALLTGGD